VLISIDFTNPNPGNPENGPESNYKITGIPEFSDFDATLEGCETVRGPEDPSEL
jgi:hypothetical protein